MHRLAALMTLIAALTGTPLRQAEAAEDLGRSLLELFQSASVEMPDGGVGDDSDLGTLSAPHNSDPTVPLTSATPLVFVPVSGRAPATRGEITALRERVGWMPHPPNARHAWLQTFLF